ncbi:hypothetical protein CCACVL1_03626 [Corchorus capsularis]|uniref:AIR9-like A9 domain-containing protein n=1 Tax=Corchorus capsularis TaxID=210143 RepID=A0A1R3JY69_COCAP|nr:hypothetical protein CCACVL1_03626 [Corchorus capsularis]
MEHDNKMSELSMHGVNNNGVQPQNSNILSRHALQTHLVPSKIRDGNFEFPDQESKDLHVRAVAQKEEIHHLREQISIACVKELQLLNDKCALERKFSDLRMAIDEKQNEVITSASNELARRKGDLEENLKLAHDLKVAEDERYIFMSSLLGLLAEYGIFPHVVNASTITSSVKALSLRLERHGWLNGNIPIPAFSSIVLRSIPMDVQWFESTDEGRVPSTIPRAQSKGWIQDNQAITAPWALFKATIKARTGLPTGNGEVGAKPAREKAKRTSHLGWYCPVKVASSIVEGLNKSPLLDSLQLASSLYLTKSHLVPLVQVVMLLLTITGPPTLTGTYMISYSGRSEHHMLALCALTKYNDDMDKMRELRGGVGTNIGGGSQQNDSAISGILKNQIPHRVMADHGFSPHNYYTNEQHHMPPSNMLGYMHDDDEKMKNVIFNAQPQQLSNGSSQELLFRSDRGGAGPNPDSAFDKGVVRIGAEDMSNNAFPHQDEMASYGSEEGPGIEGFQIIGDATPGEKLLGCGYPVRGTTLCMFQWVRHLEDGTRQYIEGATNPEYVVTADDVDKLIAVECIPMDDQGRQGELVRRFANDQNKIKCDPDMQNDIDMHISRGQAIFSVLLLDAKHYPKSSLKLPHPQPHNPSFNHS